ncbi:host attachment family protein [Rhizobium sp. BK251]|uniref:baeRF12 domain-containing protein n=1 Tax=Rhizobium sp. BK251 TaxID=2512125 RepID=UPI0010450076|nr:host attachment family protein [Rhizobium sp. BK251]TCL76241.1 protein required for attachment to host cells [Rhizobium sp. BK251]
MTDIKIPWEAWVVVCDGGKALIMQNAGDAELINLRVYETLVQPSIPDRELGTGKPGRTHQADGMGGSAVEETDWKSQAEEEFLKKIANKMDQLVEEREAKRIILVAPPTALGFLRPHIRASVQAAVTAEIPKDLTNLPVDAIERHLSA